MRLKILLCEDDKLCALGMMRVLSPHHECTSTANIDKALELAEEGIFDLIIADYDLGENKYGTELIEKIRLHNLSVGIILYTNLNQHGLFIRAIRAGADDFIIKDANHEKLLRRIQDFAHSFESKNNANKEILNTQRQSLEGDVFLNRIIGRSEKIVALKKKILRFRLSNANVLINGETGVGKELVARSLCVAGVNQPGGQPKILPFFAVDCATLTETLAESRLFGHEKGSFTGASERRKGIFESADGGIIFLDEVANMPLVIQQKLLRVLQEKEFFPVGSNVTVRSRFRIVSATNRNLNLLVKRGDFLVDLYHRLSTLPLDVPSLSERREDFELLVLHFFKNRKIEMGASFSVLGIQPQALIELKNHVWHGNVRELFSALDYLCAMSESDMINEQDIKTFFAERTETPQTSDVRTDRELEITPSPISFATEEGLSESLARYEKKMIEHSLHHWRGNISKCADQFKIDRSSLYRKMKEYGLDKRVMKQTPPS